MTQFTLKTKYMNKNTRQNKPEVLKANIGAKRKSINPKVGNPNKSKDLHGMSVADQIELLGYKK